MRHFGGICFYQRFVQKPWAAQQTPGRREKLSTTRGRKVGGLAAFLAKVSDVLPASLKEIYYCQVHFGTSEALGF